MTNLLDRANEQRERRERPDSGSVVQLGVQGLDSVDYDRAAKIFEVQAKTQLPSEVISADLDRLYDQVKRDTYRREDYTDAENGSPIFNEFAAKDPYHPIVVERDRRNLNLIERGANSLGLGIDRGDAMVELSRISNRRADGDKRPGDEEIMDELRDLTSSLHFGLDGLGTQIAIETGVQGRIQAHLLAESIDPAARGALYGGTMAAAATAWLGPGAAVTTALGMGLGAGIGGRFGVYDSSRRLMRGLAFDEYVEAGLDEDTARRVASIVGAAGGALEMLGLAAILKYIPGARKVTGNLGKSLVEKIFMKPTMRGALQRVVARYGEVMATEILTETLQESIQMAGGEFLRHQARNAGDIRPETRAMTWDDYTDAVGQIVTQTMMGTAVIGGIGPGASFIGDARRARTARANGIFIKSLGEAIGDSETRKNVPGKFREYLQAQQEKGPIKELRFPVEAWRMYWEGQKMNVDEVNQSLGLPTMEVLNTAGDDVVVSLETFGDKIAHTEHFQELWKDVKLRDGDMTYREAKAFLANPEAHVARLKKDLAETFGTAVSDDFDRIVSDVTGQLLARNYDRTAAEQQARFTAAVYTTQALRNPQANATPFALYRQRLGGIVRDVREMETQGPGAVDLAVDPLLDRIRGNNFPTQREMQGLSLMAFVVKRGGLMDEGGELSARDFGKLRVGLVSRRGQSLESMTELAHEAGYILERDPDLLMEMLDREASGDPVFSAGFDGTEATTLNADLLALADYLQSEGIDIEKMTNQEIREALESRQTFEQTDERMLKDMTDVMMDVLARDLAAPDTAIELERLVARFPLVASEQNLGDLEFVDRVRKDGREGTRTRKAQKVFDQEVKKRNSLKRLMDCMSV